MIGRIEILEIRWVQRKALPVSLFCLGQEVSKSVRPWPHIPDPKPRRQGSKMAKNTAPSFHDISSQLTIAAALNILSFKPPHPSIPQGDRMGYAVTIPFSVRGEACLQKPRRRQVSNHERNAGFRLFAVNIEGSRITGIEEVYQEDY